MAQLSIRVDDDLKVRADQLFGDLGLNLTTAVNMFFRQAVRNGGIPFELTVRDDPFYSESNMARLMESITNLNAGKGVEHDLIEVDD